MNSLDDTKETLYIPYPMPVTSDELREYDEFLLSLVKDLGCIHAPSEKFLWHYTNGQGLIGIIESGTLFSTQISCLNDSQEVKYASNLFKSMLCELRNGAESDKRAALGKIIDYFDLDEDYEGHLPYFVACFSELEDSVAQWTGYGNRGGYGYAIGFDPQGLTNMGGLLVRVNYDRATHQAVAKKAAEATLYFYEHGRELRGGGNAEEWDREFLSVWDDKLTQIAPMIKDPCWSHEQEYRIVRLLIRGELPQLRMVQKDTMMTRHLPLKLTSDWQYPTLPIRQVLVGPCPHPSITKVSADTLLRQHGYPSGLVVLSTRPYRQT